MYRKVGTFCIQILSFLMPKKLCFRQQNKSVFYSIWVKAPGRPQSVRYVNVAEVRFDFSISGILSVVIDLVDLEVSEMVLVSHFH